MSDYQGSEQADGSLKIKKSNGKLSDENAKLLRDLDYITKVEMMNAIKKIADEVGVEVNFTFDKIKNEFNLNEQKT